MLLKTFTIFAVCHAFVYVCLLLIFVIRSYANRKMLPLCVVVHLLDWSVSEFKITWAVLKTWRDLGRQEIWYWYLFIVLHDRKYLFIWLYSFVVCEIMYNKHTYKYCLHKSLCVRPISKVPMFLYNLLHFWIMFLANPDPTILLIRRTPKYHQTLRRPCYRRLSQTAYSCPPIAHRKVPVFRRWILRDDGENALQTYRNKTPM